MVSTQTTLLALLVVSVALGGACKTSDPVVEDAAVAVAEPPVPAPDGLLAEIVMTTPNTTWSRIQRGVGGAAGFFPSTLGGIVCAVAGLDSALGPEIDGGAPVFAALAGSADVASVGFAIAMKLVDPRKARAVLLDAETARFSSRDVAGMTALLPKGDAPGGLAVALARGGYLVIARSEADLVRLAPYVTRTLPARVLSPNALVVDVPGAALKGPLLSRLAAEWGGFQADLSSQDEKLRAAHGGRAPDFGDPQAILATLDAVVKSRLAMVGDLDSARVSIDADADAVHAVLALVPSPGGGPATLAIDAMHPGDATPLLSAPSSPLTILIRDDAAGRAKDAALAESAIAGALGARLPAEAKKKLRGVMDDWASARKDWMMLGLVRTEAVWLRAPSDDPERSARALRGAMELAKAPPFRQTLHVRDVALSSSAVSGIGPGTLAAISYGDGAGPPKKLELTWAAGIGQISAFLSQKSAMGPDVTAGTLGDDRVLAAKVGALEANATFVLVAQPSRMDPAKGQVPGAAFVLAWGKKGREGWARVEIADLLLRDVMKSKMGL